MVYALDLHPSGLCTARTVSVGAKTYARLSVRVVAAIAFVGTLSTLAIAQPAQQGIDTERGLGTARFGYPIHFLEAELTFNPERGESVELNPWEYPTETDLPRFLASWLLVASVPAALVYLAQVRRSRTSRRKSGA